jgi:hypothetical protein
MVLMELQWILGNPEMESSVNKEAAALYQTNPAEYVHRAHQYAQASQERVRAAAAPTNTRPPPADLGNGRAFIPFPQKEHAAPKAPAVNFDDYYRTWTQLGTTQKGHTEAPRPDTTLGHKHLNNARAVVETTRGEILYGEAMGETHGFGQKVWQTEEFHRTANRENPPPTPGPLLTFAPQSPTMIPIATDDGDDVFEDEADELLDFVDGLPLDS